MSSELSYLHPKQHLQSTRGPPFLVKQGIATHQANNLFFHAEAYLVHACRHQPLFQPFLKIQQILCGRQVGNLVLLNMDSFVN